VCVRACVCVCARARARARAHSRNLNNEALWVQFGLLCHKKILILYAVKFSMLYLY